MASPRDPHLSFDVGTGIKLWFYACFACALQTRPFSKPSKVVLKQQVQIIRGDWWIVPDGLGNGSWRMGRKCSVHSNLKGDEGFREGVEVYRAHRDLTSTRLLAASSPPCTEMHM